MVHQFTIFTAVSTIFTADANKCRESIFVLIPPSVPLLLRQIYLKWKISSYTVWGKSLEYDFQFPKSKNNNKAENVSKLYFLNPMTLWI